MGSKATERKKRARFRQQQLLPVPQVVTVAPRPPTTRPEPGTRAIPEVCPRCGEALKLRTGPYSKFLGCSGFPRCRHIVPLTKAQVEKWELTTTIRAVKNAGKRKTAKQTRRKRTPDEARTEAAMDAEFRAIIG